MLAWLAEFDVCDEAADRGPCDEDLTKYYFDAASGACATFSYGGCDGNANRFDSVEHCEHICIHRKRQGEDLHHYTTTPSSDMTHSMFLWIREKPEIYLVP